MRSFILLAILLNSVYSDESDINVQGRYNFNHPPSIESYNPIPVAVVFEDVKGKLLNDPETTTENEDIKTSTNVPLKVNLETKTSETEQGAKELTIDYFQQIPVHVIYDTEPTVLYRPTTEPNKKPKPLRRLKQRRLYRTKPTAQNENINIEVSTKSYKPEVISETVKPYVPAKPSDIKPKTTRLRDPVVPIIESENYVYSHNGNFRYSYEGGDGTKAFSEGQLKQIEDDAGEAVVGGFSYTDKDGNDFSLSYTADENGYRPVGAHLPTSPPIPPAIARALEYLATATSPKPVTNPSDE